GGNGSINGGGGDDYGRGIAVDASGGVYVTGETYSRDFPTSPGALSQSTHKAFTTKISLATQGAALANVSAASYVEGELAPAAIVAAVGLNLASKTEYATRDPLPPSLHGSA